MYRLKMTHPSSVAFAAGYTGRTVKEAYNNKHYDVKGSPAGGMVGTD